MVGAAINVIPLMLQRSVPEIGPDVLPAYMLAIVPTILAALAYAILGSAMPRAGGSYVYASRALSPYLGFIASFSQWFGLSIAIGVVSYLLIPFLRDIATTLDYPSIAASLDSGAIRVGLALAFLWGFALVNILGIKAYERALIPLMFLMFVGGAVVIPAGFAFDHEDFRAAVALRDGVTLAEPVAVTRSWSAILAASAILFSTFIGFDSIAQAGGEAKDPGRLLPLSICITVGSVATFYILFTAAVYHAVPWNFIAERAINEDLTAPGLLGYLLSPGWTVLITVGAALALINDLPAMILAVSRLAFAWAGDGIFPRGIAAVNRRWRTPHRAIVLSSLVSTAAILGCHLAGDFFLGVDLLLVAMLVNFLLICLSVLLIRFRNPRIASRIRFGISPAVQLTVGAGGVSILAVLLVVHVIKDLGNDLGAWYFHSTYLFLLVGAAATALFLWYWSRLKRSDPQVSENLKLLPPE